MGGFGKQEAQKGDNQNESRPNAPGQMAKMPYPYTTSAQIVQYPWRYVTEWKPGNHFMRMYIRTMIAFLPIWHFLEVGLSGDHIDMVKMRYKKPFQRALEHYHAEEEIRQAALKWKGMPITPHPNPRCTALM